MHLLHHFGLFMCFHSLFFPYSMYIVIQRKLVYNRLWFLMCWSRSRRWFLQICINSSKEKVQMKKRCRRERLYFVPSFFRGAAYKLTAEEPFNKMMLPSFSLIKSKNSMKGSYEKFRFIGIKQKFKDEISVLLGVSPDLGLFLDNPSWKDSNCITNWKYNYKYLR